MKLALMLGYSGGKLQLPMEQIKLAEALGYHSVWTAEAYGSDAMTPLAYIAAHTERIKPVSYTHLTLPTTPYL